MGVLRRAAVRHTCFSDWRGRDERTGWLSRHTIDLGYPATIPPLRSGCSIESPTTGIPCDKPFQRGATLIGPAWGESYVLRTCRCNAVNALVKRHLVAPVTPRTRQLFFPASLAAAIRAYYYDNYAHARAAWLAKWPESKRAAILQSEYADRLLPGRVKLMVKRENAHARPTKARGIQMYRNLRTQAYSGWRHTAFQKALGAVCAAHPDGYELFPGIRFVATSGWAPGDFAAWAGRNCSATWFFESDASNFDASVDPSITRARARFARRVDPLLGDDIASHVRGRGVYFGDVKVRYQYHGTVKSGHNDTTWGNSIVTALVAGIACRDAGFRANILAAGDDLLVAVFGGSASAAPALADTQRAFGFTPKFRGWRSLADCTFVSSCFLTDGRAWRFAPLCGRLLKRFWWTTSPPSARQARARMRGDSIGVLGHHPGHPIFEALLRKWVDPADCAPQPDGFDYTAALCAKYACAPGVLSCLTDHIESIVKPGVYHHPLMTVLFKVDLVDVDARPTSAWG